MYNAELQMLREFFWFHAPKIHCVFCKQPLIELPPKMTFGHRRHPKVRAKFTIHHDNEDRSDNRFENLFPAHSGCHRRYHKQLLMKGGKLYGEEDEEREEREEKGEVLNVGNPQNPQANPASGEGDT
jgi:hypothetical protein